MAPHLAVRAAFIPPRMDPTNTIGFISVFINTFDSGLSDFTAYSRRIWLSNSYGRERNRLDFGNIGNGQATSPVGPPGPSALKASLAISPRRIRETYDRAFILVGPEFSKGDGMKPATLIEFPHIRQSLTN